MICTGCENTYEIRGGKIIVTTHPLDPRLSETFTIDPDKVDYSAHPLRISCYLGTKSGNVFVKGTCPIGCMDKRETTVQRSTI